MKQYKTTLNKFIRILIVATLILCMYEWYSSKYCLSLSNYNIESDKITAPIRILQISDLHNSIFGKNNQKLIDTAMNQSPDIILLTGDLINSDEENIDIVVSLIKKLSDIAPVYMSLGNHEVEYQRIYDKDIESVFAKAGACVLDKNYIDLEIKGQSVRLGGIYGYYLPAKYLKTKEADVEECNFLKDFQNTDHYTILMSHIPVCWLLNDGLDEWNIDAVFSGHAHGGEIILPLIGGLYAPDFGYFPGNLHGSYYSENKEKVLILSKGLGTADKVPRFNNTPEVVIVNLYPDNYK